MQIIYVQLSSENWKVGPTSQQCVGASCRCLVELLGDTSASSTTVWERETSGEGKGSRVHQRWFKRQLSQGLSRLTVAASHGGRGQVHSSLPSQHLQALQGSCLPGLRDAGGLGSFRVIQSSDADVNLVSQDGCRSTPPHSVCPFYPGSRTKGQRKCELQF